MENNIPIKNIKDSRTNQSNNYGEEISSELSGIEMRANQKRYTIQDKKQKNGHSKTLTINMGTREVAKSQKRNDIV